MDKISYIVFGWALGLLSPLIVDFLKSYLHRREFIAALKVEMEDLQFRLAISSLSLIQSHGKFDRDFAIWAQKITSNYSGYEPNAGIRKFLEAFLTSDATTADQISQYGRSADGVGSSLKIFQARFLELNLVEILKLPISVQRKIHELRNQLGILNQDISKAETYFMMTFNSSLSDGNHERITNNLTGIYNLVQRRTKNIADSIESILSELK